ncbi:hypothetical protein K3495_g16162, partial [Podosphaera aphanis]
MAASDNSQREITQPLTALTKKNTIWRWGKAENQAFEKLKEIFATKPVLAQWDPERETVVEGDSSCYALGGCLSQVDDEGRLRPVAYHSRRLTSAEVNYPNHDREMLSIISCLQKWQPELTSVIKPFTILTDNENLKYFTSKRPLNERQVCYNDMLQRFKFSLKWRPGSACERPDALSRRDQDKSSGMSNERAAGSIMQLLPPVKVNPVTIETRDDGSDQHVDPAASARLFDDDELQILWKSGIESDNDWRRARDAVQSGERAFPPDIAYKL